MKKLALAILMTLPIYANATGREAPYNQAANMLQGQAQYQNQTGGNSSVNVQGDDARQNAASSAISPSVGTMNDCQIATPSSKAFSVLIFSASGTTGVTYNDLCFAYKMKQYDIAEQLMCAKSQDYAKANHNCKVK